MVPLRARAESEDAGVVVICGQVEAEIAELDAEEAAAFLEDMGLEPGSPVGLMTYALLGLRTYFTAGPKKLGLDLSRRALAPQCAEPSTRL